MNQHPFFSTKPEKPINPEHLSQIIEAILNGKYSWACVLFLRFSGYNPLHYIPYRTYNRIVKENCQFHRQGRSKAEPIKVGNDYSGASNPSSQKLLSNVDDLAYLELLNEPSEPVKGRGSSQLHHSGKGTQEDDPITAKLAEPKKRFFFFNW